jgi:hypothetical protein
VVYEVLSMYFKQRRFGNHWDQTLGFFLPETGRVRRLQPIYRGSFQTDCWMDMDGHGTNLEPPAMIFAYFRYESVI